MNEQITSDELSSLLINHPKIKAELLDLLKSDNEAAVKWLKQRRWPLLNETALAVLETNPEKVSDLIYQIKTGDFS